MKAIAWVVYNTTNGRVSTGPEVFNETTDLAYKIKIYETEKKAQAQCTGKTNYVKSIQQLLDDTGKIYIDRVILTYKYEVRQIELKLI